MTLEGIIKNGVVVLDQPQDLQDGLRVKVLVADDESGEPVFASLLELAGTVEGLPSDMARNHNHYLHGHPKQ